MTNHAAQLNKKQTKNLLDEMAGERFALQGNRPVGERSGFGAVWKAHDSWLGRNVALKISKSDLKDEILLCRDIEGQTVRIFDFFRGDDGWNAYSMELLEKPWMTLSHFIDEHKYKDNDLQHYFDCFEIVNEALYGLSEIHGSPYSRDGRYVHADIKPANLFFLCKPKKHRNSVFRMPSHEPMLKIIDLGISLTRGDIKLAGTPAYDHPKKIIAKAGHDLYSLGITFLELLTGIRPDHEDMENKSRIRAHVELRSSGSERLDELAVRFANLCARAASKSIISAEKLIELLDDKIFDVEPIQWLALRWMHKRIDEPMSKAELAEELFPEMAKHHGWQKKSDNRLIQIEELITDMYQGKLLVRIANSKRYFLRF